MRTGFRYLHAVSIISANCGSRLLPRPTLPGLMRSLPSACAQAGCAFSSLWPLKWKSPTNGVPTFWASNRSRMCGTAAADSSLLTVTRTNSDPARANALTCATVPSMSAVSVLVMDCTTMGEAPPMETEPTLTIRECRRDLMSPLYLERRNGSGLARGKFLLDAIVKRQPLQRAVQAIQRINHVIGLLVEFQRGCIEDFPQRLKAPHQFLAADGETQKAAAPVPRIDVRRDEARFLQRTARLANGRMTNA